MKLPTVIYSLLLALTTTTIALSTGSGGAAVQRQLVFGASCVPKVIGSIPSFDHGKSLDTPFRKINETIKLVPFPHERALDD